MDDLAADDGEGHAGPDDGRRPVVEDIAVEDDEIRLRPRP